MVHLLPLNSLYSTSAENLDDWHPHVWRILSNRELQLIVLGRLAGLRGAVGSLWGDLLGADADFVEDAGVVEVVISG